MTTEPIRRKEDIDAIKNYFLQKGSVRNYALFVLGINTGIRVSELVAMRWGDVYDNNAKEFYPQVFTMAKKTKKRIAVALNDNCKTALTMLLDAAGRAILPTDYVFVSKTGGHLSRFMAFKILKSTSEKLGLEGNISCQSMRKTLDYYVFKEEARATLLMNICNQSDIERKKRYLGIGQEELQMAYECPNL